MLFPTFETPILRAVITPSMTSTVNECDEVIWSVLIFWILCTCSILIQQIYLHTAYEQQFPQQSKRVQIANEDSTKIQRLPGRHYNRSISPQWLSMPAKQDQHAKPTATEQHLWRNQWHSWTTPNYLYLLKTGLTSESQREIIDIFGPWFRKRLRRHKNFRYSATKTEKLPKISRVKTSVFGTSSVDKTKMQCQVNAYLFLDIFLIRDLPSLSPATTTQLSVGPPSALQRRKRERTPEGHFPKGTSIPFSSHSALSREVFVIYCSMSWIIGSILLTCYSFHLVGRGNDRRQGNTLRTRYTPRANGRELPAVLVSVILLRLQTIAYYVFLPTFMHLIGRGAQTQQRNILRTRYPPPRADGRELPIVVSVTLQRLQTVTCYVFLTTYLHLIGRGKQTQQGNLLRTRYPPRADGRELPLSSLALFGHA